MAFRKRMMNGCCRLRFPAVVVVIPVFISFSSLLLLLLLLLALSPPPLHSQPGPHLLFRTLSIERGLSQNSVLSIARDHHGFLWFGTESGLNKFDGYRFTVYLPVEGDPYSLSNSWINALLVDRNGDLWIGTENGLNKYDLSAEKFIGYFHDPADPHSLSSSRIFALFEDRDGRLWVGTDAGLNLFDPSTDRFTRFQHDPATAPSSSPASSSSSLSHDQVRAIAQDANGFIWIGTVGGGLNRFDPSTGTFIHFRHDPSDPAHSLPDDAIYSLLVNPSDPSSPIWIGTASSGLVRFDPNRQEFKTYYPNPRQPHSLPDGTVNCLVQDTDGTLWIGTGRSGLSHFYPDREFFFTHRHQSHD
ncbi:MAG: ligand-binding sensor domain-containing protein, partial [Candidatus Saccharicenans sp.]